MAFGGFGATNNTFGGGGGGFGNTNNTFGGNTGGGFGNTGGGFGNTNNTFGSPATNNAGGGFGNTGGGFGGGGFGNTNNTGGGMFGNNNNAGGGGGGGMFGNTANNNTGGGGGLFGSPGTGFGANTNTNTGFGATNNTGFGATTNTGFGATNNTGFGATNNTGFGATANTGFGAGSSDYNPNKDFEVDLASCPTDTVSSIRFSPTNPNQLVAASWDCSVRLLELQLNNGQPAGCTPRLMIKHQKPVLDVAFKHDGTGCFSVGCDNVVKFWQFGVNQGQDIGKHDAPIKCARWIQEMNVLATASYDKTLKYWDVRQPNPVMTVQLPERAYCMDARHPMLVVGCGSTSPNLDSRSILVFDLNKPQAPFATLSKSLDASFPLKHQFRCVAIFPDKSGFACGTIEGRVAVQYVDPAHKRRNFAFKCHRDKTTKEIYPINSIEFHPTFHTFATAASDGTYFYWDKDSKQRLHNCKKCKFSNQKPAPVTCAAFNAPGTLYAYALGYDWSQGATAADPADKTRILVHKVEEQQAAPKPKSSR